MPLDINFTERRGDLLETCVRLFNLRNWAVGINQIQNVYMPIWRADEQDELWEHFETMLFSEQRRKDWVSQFHVEIVNEN